MSSGFIYSPRPTYAFEGYSGQPEALPDRKDSSLSVQPDLSHFLYTSSTALSIGRNNNAAPHPFPDTLNHAIVLHSALERPVKGQESSPMSTSEPHFIEEQLTPPFLPR